MITLWEQRLQCMMEEWQRNDNVQLRATVCMWGIRHVLNISYKDCQDPLVVFFFFLSRLASVFVLPFLFWQSCGFYSGVPVKCFAPLSCRHLCPVPSLVLSVYKLCSATFMHLIVSSFLSAVQQFPRVLLTLCSCFFDHSFCPGDLYCLPGLIDFLCTDPHKCGFWHLHMCLV